MQEIDKISGAFAGDGETSASVTASVQKVIDKIGSTGRDKTGDTESLAAALDGQTKAALDEETGIPAQTKAWEELNGPLGEAAGYVTKIQSALEQMDGKEYTMKVNILETGASMAAGTLGSNAGGGNNSTGPGSNNSNANTGSNNSGPNTGENNSNPGPGHNGGGHLGSENLSQINAVSGRAKPIVNPDGTVITPDGLVLCPLQPGDEMYELQKAFEPFLKKIQEDPSRAAANMINGDNHPIKIMLDQLNTPGTVITKNTQPIINNTYDIDITCPGVTSAEVMKSVKTALDREFTGLSNMARQFSMIRD